MASLTYSRAVTNPATDTDLGSQTDFQSNSWEVAKTPAKGEIKTATLTEGSGYSVPLNGTVLCSTTGSATGSGAVAQIKTAPSGILILRSPVNVTAGFMNFQNYLQLNLNIDDSQYTWARTTSTGDPMPDTVIGPVTTTAILGTGGSGTGATFLVSVNSGSVSKVTVSAVGSGYKAGDIITLLAADLQAPMNVANDNQPVIIQGDIELFLTEENISGKAIEIVSIINGGSNYVVADDLILQEIGSTQVGAATMAVSTLGISSEVITAPNTGEYPRGIMTATPGLTGATAALTGTCEFKGIDGEQVIVSGFTTGKIIPISFKEITPAGTDLTLADVTIFY